MLQMNCTIQNWRAVVPRNMKPHKKNKTRLSFFSKVQQDGSTNAMARKAHFEASGTIINKVNQEPTTKQGTVKNPTKNP